MVLRVGMLGVGRIGAMHADLLEHQVRGAQVTAVFDVNETASRQVAAEVGAVAEPSMESLLARDDVDAVCIATSTDTHVDAMIAAAKVGKAIFCEKPISLDVTEVDRGLEAVQAAGVPLQIGFNRRFDASHASVRAAVSNGDLGDIHLVRITSRDPSPPPISYIEVSGGIFRDMAIHDFDMARFVTGSEVVSVFATGAVRVDPAIGEAGDIDTAVIVMTHANGAITTIDNSREAKYGYDQRVEAFGSLGMAASDNITNHAGTVTTQAGATRPPLVHFFIERYTASYLAQWQAFVDAVVSGSSTSVGGNDGRVPLLIAQACLISIAESRAVMLSEVE